MDLRERLANLDRLSLKKNQKASSRPDFPGVEAEVLEKSLEQLQLECSSSDAGKIWTRHYFDEVEFPKGDFPSVHGFFPRAGEADPDLDEILFLDTETTGLAGGTGTMAFLVGVGWFRNHLFYSRQYFMPDFAHESAMMQELSRLTCKFKVVMTFNGASFDLPLLRTRALMNRLDDPCSQLVSWDLLVPGRRLWGKIYDNCRQQTLEKGLLEMRRGPGDIDGALIPQTWFDFIKTGDGEQIGQVLHHNQRDLLGMVGIFARVLDMADHLLDTDPQVKSWKNAWALGRIAEKARLNEIAAHWMQRAVMAPDTELDGGFLTHQFVGDAIRLLKRQGRWLEVELVINHAFQAGIDDAWLHREAAILYEHRIDRPHQALSHAECCGEPVRVQRLKKKIAKRQER